MYNKSKIEDRYLDLIYRYKNGHEVSVEELIECQEMYIKALQEEIDYTKEIVEEYRYETKED